MEVHPLAALFPMMTDDELQDLADDIRENLEHTLAKEARKQREVEVFSRWSHEQLALGRLPRELIWGNCVRETGILRGEA